MARNTAMPEKLATPHRSSRRSGKWRASTPSVVLLYVALTLLAASSPPSQALSSTAVVGERRDGSSPSADTRSKMLHRKRRDPEDKCGGNKLFYTPLLRIADGEEIGVCDSSCSELKDAPLDESKQLDPEARTELAHHYDGERRRRRRRATKSEDDIANLLARASRLADTGLYQCNATKTLPEEGVPQDQVDAFPFNMRTCYATAAAAVQRTEDASTRKQYELLAQMQFEQACTQARGTFVHPYYKTWR